MSQELSILLITILAFGAVAIGVFVIGQFSPFRYACTNGWRCRGGAQLRGMRPRLHRG